MRGAVGEFQVVAYCVERLPMIGKMFNSQVFKGNTCARSWSLCHTERAGCLKAPGFGLLSRKLQSCLRMNLHTMSSSGTGMYTGYKASSNAASVAFGRRLRSLD